MIVEKHKCITILAFNYGLAGSAANGPGICLFNFINFLKNNCPNIKINLFAELACESFENNIKINNIKDKGLLERSIKNSFLIHHWSGLGDVYIDAIKSCNLLKKPVLIGPNVIDTVEKEKEDYYLNNIKFNKLLTVNERLKYKISKDYNISNEIIEVFMVGPNLNMWMPEFKNNGKILWKGNSRQYVKDIGFGLEVAKKLPQYRFDFFGHPEPYNYFDHIEAARKYKLYFSTSLSETMGMALAEQWAAGIPSVTHPKIYLHGENYETGIITNRDINSYCDAIIEIMENNKLHKKLSLGARRFVEKNFSSSLLVEKYLNFFRK